MSDWRGAGLFLFFSCTPDMVDRTTTTAAVGIADEPKTVTTVDGNTFGAFFVLGAGVTRASTPVPLLSQAFGLL